MKLVKKSFIEGKGGFVKLIPEEDEDLWPVYSLIREGDEVSASTFRKIQVQSGNKQESERVKVTLTLEVVSMDFDPEGGSLRVSGRNIRDIEHIKLGSFHTLVLEKNRAFEVSKQVWDSVDAEIISTACDPTKSADLAVMLVTEGSALLALVGSSVTSICARVQSQLPGKRGAAGLGYEKAWTKFLARCVDALDRHLASAPSLRCLVLAGPGFAKDALKEHLDKTVAGGTSGSSNSSISNSNSNSSSVSGRTGTGGPLGGSLGPRPLLTLLRQGSVVTAHASSAFRHSLSEVILSPAVQLRIRDSAAAREMAALERWRRTFSTAPDRAFFGIKHVAVAAEVGAVAALLVSDRVVRARSVEGRQKALDLVQQVKDAGGEVFVFSSLHVSGEELNKLTGVAAILRYDFPEPDEDEETSNAGADGEVDDQDLQAAEEAALAFFDRGGTVFIDDFGNVEN